MKNDKNAITRKAVIIVLMLLVVSLYFVSGTYARYTWKGTATGKVEVAKWQVGLKTDDEAQSTTANVKFEVKDNANVVKGKIAPSYKAVGELVINPNGSEVAIDYKLKIDDSALTSSGVTLSITDVKVGETTLTKEENDYIGTISLKDQTKALTEEDAVTVVFEATWTDDGKTYTDVTADGYGANNDTVAGTTKTEFNVPVTVLMQQHIDTAP